MTILGDSQVMFPDRKFTLLHLALVRNVSDKARDSSGHYGSKSMS